MPVNESPSDSQTKPGFLKEHWRLLIVSGVVVVLLIVAYWWFFQRNRVSTDDAYVHADNAQISSRIPGSILRVLVHNNYPVKAGQTLVQMDPTDYRIAVTQAKAALAEVEADVKASEISIALTDAQTAAAVRAAQAAFKAARDNENQMRHQLAELKSEKEGVKAELALAQRDFKRFAALYAQGAGSERQRETAHTTLKKARSRLSALENQIDAASASLASALQGTGRAHAHFQSAQSARDKVEIEKHKLAAMKAKQHRIAAQLQAAELHLSYCNIVAPINGFIAQRNVQSGDRVQPGQALMAVVPLHDVYIDANFKETQLTDVRVGQPATLTADIYPHYTYHGHVAGIASGTGAAFSLLPPENATGNWIKVVRRVPVKIVLNRPPPPHHPLRVGLSMDVTINTSNQSGPMLVPASAVPAPVISPPASSMQP